MTNSVIITTFIYLAINLVIGFWRFRSISYESFVSARNQFGSTVLCLSIAGTAIGGGMFFAVSQMGYEAGIAVLSLPLSYVIGYLLLLKSTPRIKDYLRKANGHTLYDIILYRLDQRDPATKVYATMVAAVNFGMYFFMLAGQFTILATFYKFVLGISDYFAWILSLGVVAGSTFIYSIVGGIKKDIATDVFQVIVVVIGLLITFFYLARIPISEYQDVPSSHFNMTGYGIIFPIGVLLFYSPAFIGRYDYWQRIIAAQTEGKAKKALWCSVPIIFVAYIVFCMLGMYARSHAPSIDTQYSGIWSLKDMLPKLPFMVVILSFYAAIMSSADTLLNVSSVSLHNIITNLSGRRGNKLSSNLWSMRLIAALVGVSASSIVMRTPDIVDLIVGGFSSLVILSPGLAVLLFSRKPSSMVVSLSLGLGYSVFVFIFVTIPGLRKYAFIAGVLCACLPIILHFFINGFRRLSRQKGSRKKGRPL